MGCSGGVERGVVACRCDAKTVFEGAVIGQVFTGEVRVECPYAGPRVDRGHSTKAPCSGEQSWAAVILTGTIVQVFDSIQQAQGISAILLAQVFVLAAFEMARRLRNLRRKKCSE